MVRRVLSRSPENPFRISGTVSGAFFTDRERELKQCLRTLREPGGKLLMAGVRRTGKTSVLERAVGTINAKGGHAFLADFSTATSLVDLSNRLLAGATQAAGRRWTTLVRDLVTRLQAQLSLAPDPMTGLTVPSFSVALRQESADVQQASLGHVLDSLNALAAKRKIVLGVVLDEFQELSRFGETAEWHLRGVIQKHTHVSYVVAGSKVALLDAMQAKGRAFYQLFERCPFGPIDARHLAAWIDERMRSVGLDPVEAGAHCITLVGARTRDIIRLARKCVDRAGAEARVDASAVAAAYVEIIDEEADSTHRWWSQLTRVQQKVLRAVAASSQGLTTGATRGRFALEQTGSISKTLARFVAEGAVVKTAHGSGYTFDDPFVRGWVLVHAVPDLGLHLPATHIASPTSEYD
ncbi:MAG: hypothetical protein AAB224_01750 [Gemmatimonadota bacterium]